MNEKQFLELIAPYDNIIFDYGGIIIDIDYKKTVAELAKLSKNKGALNIYSKAKQAPVFNLFETGKITPKEFVTQIASLVNIDDGKENQIVAAWNAMLLGIRIERVEILKKIKSQKRIFMLSNINQIHEDYMINYINSNDDLNGFYELFEKVYFSHHMGARKPDAEVFDIVVKENNLDLAKTLFIDDSPQHVEGARAYGLNSYHLDPANSLIVN